MSRKRPDASSVAIRMGLPGFVIRGMVDQHIASGGRLPMPPPGPDLDKFLERRRIRPGSLGHLNAYSPSHWQPQGPRVGDVSRFEHAVTDVVADVDEGAVVSYQWVATTAGYPTRARAVALLMARQGDALPWWRVVRSDGCLTHPDVQGQAEALRREGAVIVGRRLRHPRPASSRSASSTNKPS